MTRNPLTGRNCSGFRFKFHVPSISSHPLYLPIEMKDLHQIRQLLDGIDPKTLFDRYTPEHARNAFRELRLKFDFDYWAATQYFIIDGYDADSIIPLILNDAQFHVIDIIRKRYFLRKTGRYIITKSFRRCGLSTCIHAFLLWMQTCRCTNNSYTCGPSEISLLPLKTNLCRHLKRDVIPPDMGIFIPKADGRAFFNTFRSPDAIRGINLGYVHFQNMSRWYDPEAKKSPLALKAAVSAVLLDYFTFVVLEGDIPIKSNFDLKDFQKMHPHERHPKRKSCLSKMSRNPFFLNEVLVSHSSPHPHFFPIYLNHSFSHCSLMSTL